MNGYFVCLFEEITFYNFCIFFFLSFIPCLFLYSLSFKHFNGKHRSLYFFHYYFVPFFHVSIWSIRFDLNAFSWTQYSIVCLQTHSLVTQFHYRFFFSSFSLVLQNEMKNLFRKKKILQKNRKKVNEKKNIFQQWIETEHTNRSG